MPNDASALLVISEDTIDKARDWIEHAIAEQELEGFSIWPVIRKDTGTLIGRCGLHRTENGDIEVAWVLARDQCGQGFATEAARAAIDYGLRVMKLNQLCALILPLNSASVAVANRCEMRFDRVVRAYKRDMLKYTIGH